MFQSPNFVMFAAKSVSGGGGEASFFFFSEQCFRVRFVTKIPFRAAGKGKICKTVNFVKFGGGGTGVRLVGWSQQPSCSCLRLLRVGFLQIRIH